MVEYGEGIVVINDASKNLQLLEQIRATDDKFHKSNISLKQPSGAELGILTNIFEMLRQRKQTYQQLARVFTGSTPLFNPAQRSYKKQRKH